MAKLQLRSPNHDQCLAAPHLAVWRLLLYQTALRWSNLMPLTPAHLLAHPIVPAYFTAA